MDMSLFQSVSMPESTAWVEDPFLSHEAGLVGKRGVFPPKSYNIFDKV